MVPFDCAGAGGAAAPSLVGAAFPLTAGAAGGSGSGSRGGISTFFCRSSFNRARDSASCCSSLILSSSFRRSSRSRSLSSLLSCSRYTLSASALTRSCSLLAASRRYLCRSAEFLSLSSARISSMGDRSGLARWRLDGRAGDELVIMDADLFASLEGSRMPCLRGNSQVYLSVCPAGRAGRCRVDRTLTSRQSRRRVQ